MNVLLSHPPLRRTILSRQQIKSGGACERAANTSNSRSGGPEFKSRPSFFSLDKNFYSTLSPFTQGLVVQTLDSANYKIKIYPVDNAIVFPNTHPLHIDLSGG